MYDLIASILDGLIGAAGGNQPPPDPDANVPETVRAQEWGSEMLARAAVLEQSKDPKVRAMGSALRARAVTLIGPAAPAQPAPAQPAPAAAVAAQPAPPVRATSPFIPAQVGVAPAAPAPLAAPSPAARVAAPKRQAVTEEPLLAGLQERGALLRAFVVMEALGAPVALRDEFGAPLMHR